MPDSLVLLALAAISVTIFVLIRKESYWRGYEEGWNQGNQAKQQRELERKVRS